MEFPVIKRLIGAINTHDLDALVGAFADDVVSDWLAHPARSLCGVEHVRRNWGFIFSRFPDVRVEVTASAVAGDEFWGEWLYVRPGAADMRGVKVITVRDDRIVCAGLRVRCDLVGAGREPALGRLRLPGGRGHGPRPEHGLAGVHRGAHGCFPYG